MRFHLIRLIVGSSEPSKRYMREVQGRESSDTVFHCDAFRIDFRSALSSRSTWDVSECLISTLTCLPRKEVIQPHLPIRLPCYDFTPVIWLTFGSWLLAVTSLTSGAPNSHGVTGGVYKARERIHRGMLIRDY